MKNKPVLLICSMILLISVLGCSFYNPLKSDSDTPSNNRQNTNAAGKTIGDQAIDATIGEEKIGVPECDELLEKIAEQSKSENDDYVSKATRQFFLNRIRDSVKQSIEENKSDKQKLAKNCLDYKNQLDKFKAEEENKK